MPTMIQRFECEACHEVYETRPAADTCARMHEIVGDGLVDPNVGLSVTVLDLWECDGEGCQNTFDDQWSAQSCEAGHETAAAEGRADLDVQAAGDVLASLGMIQPGSLRRTVRR